MYIYIFNIVKAQRDVLHQSKKIHHSIQQCYIANIQSGDDDDNETVDEDHQLGASPSRVKFPPAVTI